MSRKVAILGLGHRGHDWSNLFHTGGWRVSGFDPEPAPDGLPRFKSDWRRETTISATVHGADWVVICVPDRLELMRKVIQRAQAEAPKDATIAVASEAHSIDDIKDCAIRPGAVVRVGAGEDEGFIADVTTATSDTTKAEAAMVLAELAALRGIGEQNRAFPHPDQDAESA